MPPDQRQSLDPAHQVDHILVQHHLSQGRADEALKVVQQALRSNAVLGSARQDLSRLLIQRGGQNVIEDTAVTSQDVSSRNDLSSCLRTASVARAKFGTADVSVQKDGERALVLEPWNVDNILALGYIRSKLSK
ncbi:hypothetical protein FRC12_022539 [Ceratobasidium sp. 428]|nr:hypothetical protein FRC12_022539 [Ceratobasidium sp. 428]